MMNRFLMGLAAALIAVGVNSCTLPEPRETHSREISVVDENGNQYRGALELQKDHAYGFISFRNSDPLGIWEKCSGRVTKLLFYTGEVEEYIGNISCGGLDGKWLAKVEWVDFKGKPIYFLVLEGRGRYFITEFSFK